MHGRKITLYHHEAIDCIGFQAEIRQDGLPNDTHAVINLAGELLMNPLRRYEICHEPLADP